MHLEEHPSRLVQNLSLKRAFLGWNFNLGHEKKLTLLSAVATIRPGNGENKSKMIKQNDFISHWDKR